MSSIRDTIWREGWDAVTRTLNLEQTPTGSMEVWKRPQSWPCWCQHFLLEMALLGFCPCKWTESESMSDWRQVATSSLLFVAFVPPLLTLAPSLGEIQGTWLTKGLGADKKTPVVKAQKCFRISVVHCSLCSWIWCTLHSYLVLKLLNNHVAI